jgi:hypothetical protein
MCESNSRKRGEVTEFAARSRFNLNASRFKHLMRMRLKRGGGATLPVIHKPEIACASSNPPIIHNGIHSARVRALIELAFEFNMITPASCACAASVPRH